MKKLSLFIAFVGIFSTAIFANKVQQEPKKTEKPAKLSKTKPIKRVSATKAVQLKKDEVKKEELKSK
ncbi:MAG: hypothetical protein JNL24_00835 [Bacteroidia bacterium]|nr:hypothetical protein [Bacteroidia bacterium]